MVDYWCITGGGGGGGGGRDRSEGLLLSCLSFIVIASAGL